MARKPSQKTLYKRKNEYLAQHFEKVTPLQFYQDMFPEGYLERIGCPDDKKPNAIFAAAYSKNDPAETDVPKKSFVEIFNETLEKEYEEYCKDMIVPISMYKFKQSRAKELRYELRKKLKARYAINHLVFDKMNGLDEVFEAKDAEFIITSPVTYFGKSRQSENAYHLWGIAIDLDGVTPKTLEDLHYQIQNKVLPCPTYIANSGNGLHVYYLFEEPVPLLHHYYKPLNRLKKALTNIVWNAYTSVIPPEKKQYQGIFQGFRAVGSQSKLGKNYPVVAFRTGRKGMLMDLNEYVSKEDQINFNDLQHTSLEAARLKWPEWYEKRIVNGEPRGRWTFNRALYDSWIRRIKSGAYDGNRYWCIAVLAADAVKCGIDYDEALTDALDLLPWLNSLTQEPGNDFTAEDIYDAFGFYEDSFVNYPIRAIEAHTKIQLPKVTRNHRQQKVHLGRIRALQKFDDPDANWRNKNGRPVGAQNKKYSTKEKIIEWRQINPDGTKAECNRATGLDPKTIRKWWDEVTEILIQEKAKEKARKNHSIFLSIRDFATDNEESNLFSFTSEEHEKISSWELIEKKIRNPF